MNPALANLTYGTPSENHKDTVAHGRHPWANRTHCPQGHEYAEANVYVDPRGSRRCVTCIRAQSRSFKQKEASRCA